MERASARRDRSVKWRQQGVPYESYGIASEFAAKIVRTHKKLNALTIFPMVPSSRFNNLQ